MSGPNTTNAEQQPPQQLKISTQLFAPAAAEQPEAVAVVADMGTTGGDIKPPEHRQGDAGAFSGATAVVVAPDEGPTKGMALRASEAVQDHNAHVVVGVFPVWAITLGWLVAVIALTQAVKRGLKALGLKDRLGPVTWRRWLFVVPIVAGIMISLFFGPGLAHQFGLELDIAAAVLFLGPGSGMAAGWLYDATRRLVLPVVAALLPAVVIAAVERITGITIPDDAKEAAKDVANSLDVPSEVLALEGLAADSSEPEPEPEPDDEATDG